MLTQLAFWSGQASYFLVLALYLQHGRGLARWTPGLVFTILAVAYCGIVRAGVDWSRGSAARSWLRRCAGARCRPRSRPVVAESAYGGSVARARARPAAGRCRDGAVPRPAHIDGAGQRRPAARRRGVGVLSTMQQVGNAVGVAVIGVLFFGAVPDGYAHAFELSTLALSVLLVGVAGCARCLPRAG